MPSPTSRWPALLVLLAAVGLGCTPTEQPLAALSQTIIGGTVDNADPAVVAISADGSVFCTGTLIGPQTVLTAAHCIEALGAERAYAVHFGVDALRPTRTVAVRSQRAHPDYNPQLVGRDVGVLRLQDRVADITPVRFNPSPLSAADVGKSVKHVGFGVTDGRAQTGDGLKRTVTVPVREVSALELESGAVGKQTCNGDSGGPALMVTAGNTLERVVGITSYGDRTCEQFGYDTRVDSVAGFIVQTAAAWEALGSCAQDKLCLAGCEPADPDCACSADGECNAQCLDVARDPDCARACGAEGTCAPLACPTPDPDCVATGGACTLAVQCRGSRCISDPQHPALYCSQTCAGETCPAGMACTGGLCQRLQLPEVAPGQACTEGTFCTGGAVCAGRPEEPTLCATPCPLGTCGGTDVCLTSGGVSFCAPATPDPGEGALLDGGGVLRSGEDPALEPRVLGGCTSAGGGALGLLALLGVWRRRRAR